jgi:hypothetical protein
MRGHRAFFGGERRRCEAENGKDGDACEACHSCGCDLRNENSDGFDLPNLAVAILVEYRGVLIRRAGE